MNKKTQSGQERYLRLKLVVSHLGSKNLKDLCEKAGVNYASLRNMSANRISNYPQALINYIEEHYPRFNINYLMTGDKPVLLDPASKEKQTPPQESREISTMISQAIPYYDAAAAAGNPSFTFEDSANHPSDTIHVNALSGAEVAISVFGDSMSDAFPGGSIIALRRVEDFSIIPYGEAYVIETKDYRLLKYIRRGSTPETILLVSHNEAYEPFEIERSKIKRLYKVMGLIRRISS